MAKKLSKPAVAYRPAVNPAVCCGTCVMFHDGDCDLVKGRISPDAVCDRWEPPPSARRAASDLPGLAAEAYLSGWALTGAPLTDRVRAGCAAAVATALEHRHDPRILEATLDLGHLEGIWAVIYRRREKLLAKHVKTVMAAWNACVQSLDARQLARRFRADAYIATESANPHTRFWRDTGIAAALGWLRAIYRSDGYDALIAAIEDAIRSGIAEGEADALALAASQQGKTGFDIAAAFAAAYGRLADDHMITAAALAALTSVTDGAGTDLGRRLAAMAGDGSSEDDMADAVTGTATGDDVRSVRSWIEHAIYAAIGAAVSALYALAGVKTDWITAGGNVCPVCLGNEKNSPYAPGQVPSYPAHIGCQCSLGTSSRIPLSFLAAFLP